MNACVYCHNNPIPLADRNGMWPSLDDIRDTLSDWGDANINLEEKIEMLFKRLPVIIVCMAVSITSGGCMSRGERLAYAWKSDQEQSDEIMENIVRALEEKDSAALLKQFSKRTQKEEKDLEKQIEGLMEYYQGERKEFKGDAATSEETEYGKLVEKSFLGNYKLTTDQKTYRVCYKFNLSDENKENVGLTALEFVTEETYQKGVEAQGYYPWRFQEGGGGAYWTE